MLIFLFSISLIVVTFLVLYGLLQSKVRSETEVQNRIKKIDAITAMPRKGQEKTEAEKAALLALLERVNASWDELYRQENAEER